MARFLTNLAEVRRVSASTQNQALAALLFLYREVLELDLPWLHNLVRAKRRPRLPVVLSRHEVSLVLRQIDGVPQLVAVLLYGSGLRLLEACSLRVKDVDLSRGQIMVRGGKGDRDRVTVLPSSCRGRLEAHLENVHEQHQADLRRGAGWVELPRAFAAKSPDAGREWPWQWVFPATRTYVERVTGKLRRHHLHETVVQKAVREAVRRAGIPKSRRVRLFFVETLEAL